MWADVNNSCVKYEEKNYCIYEENMSKNTNKTMTLILCEMRITACHFPASVTCVPPVYVEASRVEGKPGLPRSTYVFLT